MIGSRARTLLFGALVALGLLGVAVVAVRQPAGAGDYLAIWGLKARALSRSGTLSSLFRVDPAGLAAHPEYPPLWPATLAVFSSLAGPYDDLIVTLLWPLLALAASLLAMRATRAAAPEKILAGAALALLPYFRTPVYVGYAEALLVVLLLGALSEVDRNTPGAPFRLALFLALACLTKNEGLVASAVFIAVLVGARRFRTAGIAAALVLLVGILPWALYRRALLGPLALADFSVASFRPDKLVLAARAITAEAIVPSSLWLIGAAVLLLLAPATCRRRAAVLIGMLLYVGTLFLSFAFSSLDLAWHVRWSWDRLALVPIALIIPVLVEAAVECISTEGLSPSRTFTGATGVH
ncbi:MAG: hypothetical protein ABIT01_12670 [Thermoanaerobaculia bacterium]